MKTAAQRIAWIDWAKAIGILLVLWGQWIYSFHIPLFFFISGYLAKNSYQLPFKAFAKKYARSLVIPYFTLGLAAYGVWLIKEMVHPVSVVEPIPLWRPLVGMLYGSGADTACLK